MMLKVFGARQSFGIRRHQTQHTHKLAGEADAPKQSALCVSSPDNPTLWSGPEKERSQKVEVTKALAALQPLYGKDNVEVVTEDGTRVRGTVKSLRTTQALTTPSVKMERGDGQVVKIPFNVITEIIDHNSVEEEPHEEGRRLFGRRFLLSFF